MDFGGRLRRPDDHPLHSIGDAGRGREPMNDSRASSESILRLRHSSKAYRTSEVETTALRDVALGIAGEYAHRIVNLPDGAVVTEKVRMAV
jgi:hypothetical protein